MLSHVFDWPTQCVVRWWHINKVEPGSSFLDGRAVFSFPEPSAFALPLRQHSGLIEMNEGVCVFPRTVVFTGLNTAYYSVLYHNHQNTNWENIFWKNCVCPSSRVPERMKSMTMLMLVFPFNLSLICIYATQTLCTFLSLKPPLVWHVSCTMFDSIPDHNSSWSPFWKLNKRALMHRY